MAEGTGENGSGLRERYESLKRRGSEALDAGKLEKAAELLKRAHGVARRVGDPELEDLAFINRAAAAYRSYEIAEYLPALREMLLRTGNARVALFAAYNLALGSDQAKDFQKALFYARISHRYATELGETRHAASSLNVLGNAYVALNEVDAALEQYRKADRLLGEGPDAHRATIRANLGYCHLIQGRLDDGLQMVLASLRASRRDGNRSTQTTCHLCLCFGYLLKDRPSRALDHGHRAAELAEETGDAESVKYSLLLLGECYKKGGNEVAAHECFQFLQDTFYPEMPGVPAMMLVLDICKIINLRA